MKIGFVLDDSLDKPDGVQQYILTLGSWLIRRGHQVYYLVGESRRKDIPNVISLSHNRNVSFNGNRLSTPLPVSKTKLRKLLDKHNFDVLHLQMPFSPFLGGRIVKNAQPQTAVIGTFHVLPYNWTMKKGVRLLGLLTRRQSKHIDSLISVSRPAAHLAKKSYHKKSLVLPNVVDVERFARGKRLAKFNDGKTNIVFLGRLVERKGCLLLLKAIEHLHNKHQLVNVRVLICGQGPERPKLEHFVEDHKLKHLVHFAGFINEEDKADYLASADLAVFPSLGGESFGIVLLEAMAAGAGVVLAGDNPGYRSVLGERPEQLIKPNNTDEFAKKLKHYLYNTQVRRRAQKWQEHKILEFDVQHIGPIMLELYTKALQTKVKMR